MKFRIESPGHRLSPSLKTFVKEKLGTLDKFYKDIQEIEATLFTEVKGNKETVVCTVNIRVPGKDEYVKGSSQLYEDAVLKAAEAAKRRLRIRKTQLLNARKRKTTNRRVTNKVIK